jgi:hypothetical protein
MDLVMGVGVDPATGDVVGQPDLTDDLEPGQIDRRIRELAEADRTTHPPQEPEPPGRRLPLALDGGRQGVER